MSSKPWDALTRDEARALIAEHKVVALEVGDDKDIFGKHYDDESKLKLRLGNGRLLAREDTGDYYGETWNLMHEVIDATASNAPLKLTSG